MLYLEYLEERLVPAGLLAAYEVSGPSYVPIGQYFPLVVRPVDAFGQPHPVNPGSVAFTSDDPLAVLPGPFTFGPGSPSGDYLVPGFRFATPGSRTITLTQNGTPAPVVEAFQVVASPGIDPPPLNLRLHLSKDLVREGESFLLTGSFHDPSETDGHVVLVTWGDQTSSSRPLPGGQHDFAFGHVYRRNLSDSDLSSPVIEVTVRDSQGQSISKSTEILVGNVAPNLRVGGDAFLEVGNLLERVGLVADPGDPSQIRVQVDYGDGSLPQTLGVGPDRRFLMRHAYQREGSYVVRVTASDGRSGFDRDGFYAEVMLPGIPPDSIVKEFVSPGDEEVVQGPGVSVTYTRGTSETGMASVLLATVPLSVAFSLDGEFFTSSDTQIVAAYEIRTGNVSVIDQAIFTFDFTDPGLPILSFFDVATGEQRVIPPSAYFVDAKADRITLMLDGDTFPTLNALGGTVFTIAVPLPDPPLPNLDTSSLLVTVLNPTIDGDLATVFTPILAGEQRGSLGLLTGKSAVTLLQASSISGGGAHEELALALAVSRESGPLRELPVAPGPSSLPSVILTPASTEPPLLPEPDRTPPTDGMEEQEEPRQVEAWRIEPARERLEEPLSAGRTLPGDVFAQWALVEDWSGGPVHEELLLVASALLAGREPGSRRNRSEEYAR